MDLPRMLGGRYLLEEEIGRGGMAVVWRARDEVLGRRVAVKVVAGRFTGSRVFRERIRKEARAAAALSHPNIAQVYDYGESDLDGAMVPYVVMELVHGRTLEQHYVAGEVTHEMALRVCAEVAAALAAAHADGLVHRDVKPANVIVTETGAKVVDFGIAAAVSAGTGGEPGETLLGTPAYIAPERMTDDAVSPASDVYALGVLLYKLLARRLPWDVEGPTETLVAHAYSPPAPLPPLPDVPTSVIDLCRRCLRKRPADRPSAGEAASILAAASGTDAAHRRRRWIPLVAAAATLAAAGAAFVLVPRGHDTTTTVVLAPSVVVSVAPSSGAAFTGASVRPTGPLPPVPGVPLPQPTGMPAGHPATPGPGSPPAAPAPTTRSPETTPPGDPGSVTILSAGGTVEAECRPGDLAVIVSATPAVKFRLGPIVAGPAAQATVDFKHGSKKSVRAVITCSAGVPSGSDVPLNS